MFVIIYTKFVSTFMYTKWERKRDNRLFSAVCRMWGICVCVSPCLSMCSGVKYTYIIYLYPLCISVGSCLASDGGASE